MEFWKSLIDQGLMPPAQHGDSRDLFLAGRIAFWMSSTGNIGRVTDGAQFAFGTDFLPGNVSRGATVGGAALAMFPSDEAKELATWRFLKWLVQPENSIAWTLATGYVPIQVAAAEAPEVLAAFAEKPAFVAGFEQLKSPASIRTSGRWARWTGCWPTPSSRSSWLRRLLRKHWMPPPPP
ncbi:MAG: extracellular solute-binding protein [Chloroflexi bacterium]|nr:extracellular solute-binding protein [Chloroflexota bacterium]